MVSWCQAISLSDQRRSPVRVLRAPVSRRDPTYTSPFVPDNSALPQPGRSIIDMGVYATFPSEASIGFVPEPKRDGGRRTIDMIDKL